MALDLDAGGTWRLLRAKVPSSTTTKSQAQIQVVNFGTIRKTRDGCL